MFLLHQSLFTLLSLSLSLLPLPFLLVSFFPLSILNFQLLKLQFSVFLDMGFSLFLFFFFEIDQFWGFNPILDCFTGATIWGSHLLCLGCWTHHRHWKKLIFCWFALILICKVPMSSDVNVNCMEWDCFFFFVSLFGGLSFWAVWWDWGRLLRIQREKKAFFKGF